MSEPVQYTEGFVDFCGIKFAVDSRALIPRFETEFIVKKVLAWCREHGLERVYQIADIGTGSGVIAIAIAANFPKSKIFATDISTAALALAWHNAKLHNVDEVISFLPGHLLSPIFTSPALNLPNGLDIIAANLPYIASGRIAHLDSSVRDFEPHTALDGGRDGFDIYRQLLDQIACLNQKPQFCIFEIDDNQANLAMEECRQRFPDALSRVHQDSSQFNRYLTLEL